MVKHRISLKDVAQKVGVSMVTVSAAVNGNGRVSRELGEKIREVAREMGYRPNAAAQILKNSPKDLGLLILEKSGMIRGNAGIQDAIVQFMKLSREKFRRCQMEWFDPDRHPDELPHMLTDGLVGGVICYGHAEKKLADYLEHSAAIPIVRLHEAGAYTVDSDMKEGIRRTVHYLAELGHKRIGMINGREFDIFQQARKGFETGMAELGQTDRKTFCYRECILYGEHSQEIRQIADYILSFGEERPTALLVHGAPIARSLISELGRRELRVPEDISMVSFIIVDWEAQNFVPSITALEYSYQKIISSALDILLDLMNHKEPPAKNISIMPELTIRESVKKIGTYHKIKGERHETK